MFNNEFLTWLSVGGAITEKEVVDFIVEQHKATFSYQSIPESNYKELLLYKVSLSTLAYDHAGLISTLYRLKLASDQNDLEAVKKICDHII